ncbi:MAG: hypothetical protein UV42_C0012G0018 [Candidatus Magasanikbacteria bacterium GW2011_GWE2_42_7]|uniref:Uncharacterized protein n=1 Tax=Candidatus Magasanikbacteria bacterium GW2011_GWE2_42_7 TaxID=1619052 RepID=A0A0G1DMZ7_9BACT|nr:MAG: hypothetical protein UV42_C0012G0018 [Candidatus Magasanikbacteria bacterium GW2011_GWE2_42_7]
MSRDIQQQSTEAESDSHELPTREQAPDPMESAYQEIAALLEDAPEALTQERKIFQNFKLQWRILSHR